MQVVDLLPIGLLMMEHSTINHMVDVIKQESDKMESASKLDLLFVDVAVDFFRTYADRCHHGKEERILFRDLTQKSLISEHRMVMQELIEEHNYARSKVKSLVAARESYAAGNNTAFEEALKLLQDLVRFYPLHTEKEDKRFFWPVMDYFSQQERDGMVEEFSNFDRKMIHEKYLHVVQDLERIYGLSGKRNSKT